MKHKWIIGIGLFLLADLALLLSYTARPLWVPLYQQLTGKQTTQEVVERISVDRPQMILLDIKTFVSLTLIGLKEERMLEVWGHRKEHPPEHLVTYPFTGYSGQLGPKLREGDRQIPEGIYRIEYLNPNSSYHLSMKVNYPNAFDRAKGAADGREQLGFDIFIHGKSATIGCIPIGDPAIESLFAMVAIIGPHNTQVVLSPYDMRLHSRELQIAEIDWEDELYQQIKRALAEFTH